MHTIRNRGNAMNRYRRDAKDGYSKNFKQFWKEFEDALDDVAIIANPFQFKKASLYELECLIEVGFHDVTLSLTYADKELYREEFDLDNAEAEEFFSVANDYSRQLGLLPYQGQGGALLPYVNDNVHLLKDKKVRGLLQSIFAEAISNYTD